MSKEEKLSILAEAVDVDKDVLNETTNLTKMEEWDSLAVLSFMSLLSTKCGKKVSPQDVAAVVTVADALAMME